MKAILFTPRHSCSLRPVFPGRRRELNFSSIPAYSRTTNSVWCCAMFCRMSARQQVRHVSLANQLSRESPSPSRSEIAHVCWCRQQLQCVVYADWNPLPTAPLRKGILENKHRRSWQSCRVFARTELESNLVRSFTWFSVRWRTGFLPTAANKTIFWSFLQLYVYTQIMEIKLLPWLLLLETRARPRK